MNKLKKVVIISIFILCSCYLTSNASSLTELISNNIFNNQTTNSTSIANNTFNSSNTNNTSITNNTNNNVLNNNIASQPAKDASVFSNLPEAELGLGNVLNILLIVVGVLIILLAIAILIRMKKY